MMNLLRITNFTSEQIHELFQLVDCLQEEHSYSLAGKTFILFFPESSIRTRMTFEKGIMDLGGRCLLFPPETLDKREELRDVLGYLENWADGVIVRHPKMATVTELAEFASIPVINAMTSENHPCEILADLYTMSRMKPNYKKLVYTFVGAASNISRTWLEAAEWLNLQFNQVCQSGYELGKDTINYQFYTDLDHVLPKSDVVLTDSLPEELRIRPYIDNYQITLEKMRMAKDGAILNPCSPFFRNEEVSSDAIDSDYFVGYEFKKNLLYVQQAILLYCLLNR
jgi:ornithine carbamoyltransferase